MKSPKKNEFVVAFHLDSGLTVEHRITPCNYKLEASWKATNDVPRELYDRALEAMRLSVHPYRHALNAEPLQSINQ